MLKILITGASGHLGSKLAGNLLEQGHHVRALSSKPRPSQISDGNRLEWVFADLASGEGLGDAVRDMDVVFHLASDPRRPHLVDRDGSRELLRQARIHKVRHFVFCSITGIHQPGLCNYSYYKLKLEVEGMIRSSGVPYSILRATQFHYFLDLLLSGLARVPLVVPLPAAFQFQPVDEAEVATRLAQFLAADPTGSISDFAGPEILSVDVLAAAWAQARGVHKRHLPVPLPGAIARAFREGRNTNPGAAHGKVTWCDWLARRKGLIRCGTRFKERGRLKLYPSCACPRH